MVSAAILTIPMDMRNSRIATPTGWAGNNGESLIARMVICNFTLALRHKATVARQRNQSSIIHDSGERVAHRLRVPQALLQTLRVAGTSILPPFPFLFVSEKTRIKLYSS